MKLIICFFLVIAVVRETAFGQDTLDLRRRVDTIIDYRNRQLKAWRSSGPVVMNQQFNFDSVTVNDFVRVSDVVFKSDVNITRSLFKPAFLFSNDSLSLQKVEGISFEKSVIFENDTFFNACDFRKGIYSKQTSIHSSTFKQGVDFTGAEFQETVSFLNTDFGKSAHFVSTTFRRGADFSDCHFGRMAYFGGVDLGAGSTMLFNDAVLPDSIDFSELQYIPQPIDFTAAAIYDDNKRHYLFLDRTDISHLILDYSHFGLIFRDPKIAQNVKDTGIGKSRTIAIYEALLANFKARGQFEDYNNLYADFREYRVSQMNFFDRLWNIYASSPFHVLGGTLILFLLLSIANVFTYRALNDRVYSMGHFGPEVVEPERNRKSRFTLKEFSHSMIYTAFIFFSFTIKWDELHFRSRGLLIWFFTIYIFGLAALFFLTHLIFSASPGI